MRYLMVVIGLFASSIICAPSSPQEWDFARVRSYLFGGAASSSFGLPPPAPPSSSSSASRHENNRRQRATDHISQRRNESGSSEPSWRGPGRSRNHLDENMLNTVLSRRYARRATARMARKRAEEEEKEQITRYQAFLEERQKEIDMEIPLDEQVEMIEFGEPVEGWQDDFKEIDQAEIYKHALKHMPKWSGWVDHFLERYGNKKLGRALLSQNEEHQFEAVSHMFWLYQREQHP